MEIQAARMNLQLGLNAEEILSLAGATAVIALVLLVEHLLTGRRHWPARWYYAEGLLAVLGGLLMWAAALRVTVTWDVAIAMMLAGCASGGPDFLWLRAEQRREREAQWQQLAKLNAEWAAKLALMEQIGGGGSSRAYARLQELGENLSFTLGAADQEIRLLQLFLSQAAPIFEQIIAAAGVQNSDASRPA